ncbi:hypothetical protein RUM43_013463 [Polyplax serrata]|uniref:CBM21 domain-containing protein n=1 Tax=Polyplax serrata TaxID=468196 RepID=A0AAN8P5J5_POLSC
MSTERVTLVFNSLFSEKCTTEAEVFAQCLQQRLQSLKDLSKPTSESKRPSQESDGGSSSSITSFDCSPWATFRPGAATATVAANCNKHDGTELNKQYASCESDKEFHSYSQPNEQDLYLSKTIKGITSDDNTVGSWSSYQENLTEADVDDKRVKGSPKVRNRFNKRKERFRMKNESANNSPQRESLNWRRSEHQVENQEDTFDLELHIQGTLLDRMEDNLVHHRTNIQVPMKNLENHTDQNGNQCDIQTTSSCIDLPCTLHTAKYDVNEFEQHSLALADILCENKSKTMNLLDDSITINTAIVSDESDSATITAEVPQKLDFLGGENTKETTSRSSVSSSNVDANDILQGTHGYHSPNNGSVSSYTTLRRCSSLKSGKTPPGTPGAKKIVRFADALGLELTDIRTFLDEIPKIPHSAYDDLHFEIPGAGEFELNPKPTLMPQFQQPGHQLGFIERVYQNKICLETALVPEIGTPVVVGCVRVGNVSYRKSVYVRYTLNNWETFSDLQATYVPHSCDGVTGKFSFVLYGHTLNVGGKLEFALRLDYCEGQYWDNNGGINYIFNCLPKTSSCNTISKEYFRFSFDDGRLDFS